MHLKKLELAGFKSFADRVQMTLGTGLNAVVGPNGSGKSNISDALRWVLGEQSARQLRGSKMEDVIFSGTVHRKPLGYAEIIMTLDNADSAMPMDFPEITIARRVYRSGESEYSINGTACRLKDIQLLFMDTGVGRDGYSMIGQGRIDEILSVRSEDRRLVFEEAAGIGKYKSRRNEALNKLEKERQNRARVDDIISELEEQVPPLEAQAEEASRFLKLRDQYKNVHISLFLEEDQRIQEELAKTNEALSTVQSQTNSGQSRLISARQAGEKLRAMVTISDTRYRRANETLLETTTAIEKKESEGKLLENQAEQYQASQTRLTGEIDKRETAKTAKNIEINDQKAIHQETEETLIKLIQELQAQESRAALLDEAQQESAQMLESLNQAIQDEVNTAAECKSHVLDAESRYRRLEEDKERLNIEISSHEEKLKDQQIICDTASKEAAHVTSESERVSKTVSAYQAAYAELHQKSQELEQKHRHAQDALSTSVARYKALSSLEASREGYFRSVKAVLHKKATDPKFSGICGAVSELIGVSKEYEIAVEIALGGTAQNIVTKTEEDAKQAIEMLKQNREGRATFLPLTSVKGRITDDSKLKHERGFIGIASDLVEYDRGYEPIIAHVLGNAIIVDTIDNALLMHKKYRYSNKIVTLDGELLSPGGAMTGGSTNRGTSGIVGRGRQLAELELQVTELKNNVADMATQYESQTQKRQATEEALHRARDAAAAIKLKESNLQDKLTLVKNELHHMHQQANTYNEENDKLMIQLMQGNKAIRDAKIAQHNQENAIEVARIRLSDYTTQMSKDREHSREETQNLMELKIEISRQEEWQSQARANIVRLEKEHTTLANEITTLHAELAFSIEKSKYTADAHKQAIDSMAGLQTSLDKAHIELTETESEKANLDAAILKAEQDERTYTDEAARLAQETTRLEMRKEQLDQNSHRIHNEIWEEYELTLQQAASYKREDLNEAMLKRESQALKSELATMTNVNLAAVEAYKQLKTRYDFLTTQRNDILQAEASLDELITTLTSQMEDQFSQQFTLIAEHFSVVFREMFGGGSASLKLQNTENVLESGIEITAQPPGKALQNMMLLSGGERALTAIALLFAILRLKPSPFCVLDEIESALDDANVMRFAKYLKEHVSGTQFIAITHRKGTMEVADNLYGVTMEEQGVSKLVSVKFSDTAS